MAIQKITRREIITTAIRVFRMQGYYRTTMRDLEQETGLTKGAFYHHFKGGKEELMETALMSLSHWFDEKVFYIAYQEDIPPEERLNMLSELAFDAFTSDTGGCFLANTILETAHVEDTFLPIIKSFFNRWEDAISKVFSEKVRTQSPPGYCPANYC